MYGFMLIAAFALGSAAFFLRARRAALRGCTTPVLALLCAVLSPLCARVYLHVTKYASRGLGGFVLLSDRPYEYALCGAVLGVVLAGVLTAKCTRRRAGQVLDALAPAGLLALAVARLGEVFSDFGWGQMVMEPAWQRFPFAVQDMYGQWHLAVFMLEAAAALVLAVFVWRLRRETAGDVFLTALLWLSMTQIFCESLRAETIRWGFVRVQQVQCALFGLFVLAMWALRRRSVRGGLIALTVYLAGVGAVVFLEYALDKLPMPQAFDYAVMAAVLGVMGLAAMRAGGFGAAGEAKA